jgi:hypothetical protein
MIGSSSQTRLSFMRWYTGTAAYAKETLAFADAWNIPLSKTVLPIPQLGATVGGASFGPCFRRSGDKCSMRTEIASLSSDSRGVVETNVPYKLMI